MNLHFMMQTSTYKMTALALCVGIAGCATANNTNNSSSASGQNTATGEAFAVNGERIDMPVPDSWKLAYMEGNPNGEYYAEYIPVGEDINSWESGYMILQRYEYPASLAAEKGTFSEQEKAENALAALPVFVQRADQRCAGDFASVILGEPANTVSNFAVSGGYCDQVTDVTPFGEGTFFGVAVGDEFVHRVGFHWRPATEEASQSNLPWRLPRQSAEIYLRAIQNVRLCGAEDQASCQHNTL